MNNKLKEVYSPENFQKLGHKLVDLLTNYLQNSQNQKTTVQSWETPQEQLNFWENYHLNGQSPIRLFEDVIQHSMRLHHPHYIGHQIAVPAPLSALTGLMGELLNNGMAIYEMGPAASAIEKLVVDFMCQKAGFGEKGSGILTSGGSLANLTALLTARKVKAKSNIWEEGHQGQKLGVMVSEEAHYCIDRAARIMGLGTDGIIKVPADDNYKIRTDLLEESYRKASSEGIEIIALVGNAPSTSTGIYDDLDKLGDFAQEKNIWFHIDGAHGGAAICSEKYKYLLKGIEKADSITIDAHKMMMNPALTTFLLFRNGKDSYATFHQKAQYLWTEADAEEWFNYGKRTFECTKLMMSLRFYVLLQTYGEGIFEELVNQLYDIGRTFAEKIKVNPYLELAVQPDTNIVCFRYKLEDFSEEESNVINLKIRQEILEKNEFYIVQTNLRGIQYLRTTFMNPLTAPEMVDRLIGEVVSIGKKLASFENIK